MKDSVKKSVGIIRKAPSLSRNVVNVKYRIPSGNVPFHGIGGFLGQAPLVLPILFGATKLSDELFHIQSFNPATDGCRRRLRAGPSVDYDRPSGPFEQGPTQ